MNENPEQDHIIYSMTQLDQDDEDIIYMQNYLSTITQRINPPFFERKMQRGIAETIEEEIEELYSEMFELDAYIKSLVNTNALLLNNYEEKTRDISEKRQRLSEKYQVLKEELQQQKKDLNEMESMKTKIITRNEALSEQIKKMEQIYNRTSKQYDNLSEEILTMSDYEDKLYQLKDEWSLNQDLINNLKYEHNEYQMMMGIIKQKSEKKEKSKSILRNKLNTIEEKLKNLNDKEKSEKNIIEHMTHHLEFLKKTYLNLKEVNQRKEEEKKLLNLMIEQNQVNRPRKNNTVCMRTEGQEVENLEFLIANHENPDSVPRHDYNFELNLGNLENEFREMNIKDDVFSNMSANQFALLSHRNTKLFTPGRPNQTLTPQAFRSEGDDRNTDPKKQGDQSIQKKDEEKKMTNSSKFKNKKKKENPDQVYIETLKFFVKHKYKILFVCFLVPMLRLSYV